MILFEGTKNNSPKVGKLICVCDKSSCKGMIGKVVPYINGSFTLIVKFNKHPNYIQSFSGDDSAFYDIWFERGSVYWKYI